MHWLVNGELVHNHPAVLILQPLNAVLGPVEDLVALEQPGGLLLLLRELCAEDRLLVLNLLDLLVLQGHHPLFWLLKR